MKAKIEITKDRVIKKGKVAVAYSPSFGAGWTTWNKKINPFEPKVIELILANRQSEINDVWVKENLGVDAYTGGTSDLVIAWLPIGTIFRIEEYDGAESICTVEDLTYKA
jgi:hypothetical protein